MNNMPIFEGHNTNQDINLEKAQREFASGSVEAFNFLYERYNRKLYWYCVRMLGNSDAAKDAYQEAFIKVYDKRSEFQGENFASWLFTIARNICLNIIRTRRIYVEIEEDAQVTDHVRESDIGMREFIEKSLEKLPITYREALILREYQECTYQEIAEILNIDLSNAKVRVHRARSMMRKILAPIAKEYYSDSSK